MHWWREGGGSELCYLTQFLSVNTLHGEFYSSEQSES